MSRTPLAVNLPWGSRGVRGFEGLAELAEPEVMPASWRTDKRHSLQQGSRLRGCCELRLCGCIVFVNTVCI